MPNTSLIKLLSGITELSPEFITALSTKIAIEKYNPNQALHAAGYRENRLYFIENGFLRNYYFDHDNIEHTIKFWEPGEIHFTYEGYYEVPSYFYTAVMGTTELLTLSYADLHSLGVQFPEVATLIKINLLKYQQDEFEKQKLIALPAEERYHQLRKKKPKYFQRIPIKHIASYLQMSRETLTRFMGKR